MTLAEATAETVTHSPRADTTHDSAGSTGGSRNTSGDWAEPVAQALHGEEVARARGWSIAVVLLCFAAVACVPLLPGGRWDKLVFSVTVLALATTGGWCWLRCRDEQSYDATVFRVFGYVAATASFEIEYFLGVFSPTPLVVTLGITFFGMGMDRRHALAIPLYAIGGYLVLSSLIASGVLADRGVINANGVAIESKIFFVGIAPLVLAVTLWMARVSRRTMADALAQAAEASRLAAEREALLAEAQHDLEQLLNAGAGRSGRFTGSQAGEFKLEEIIGRGAMGEVYAASNDGTGERAAIKLLRPDAMVKERMLERFLREGETAGSLSSPNVVQIYDVGQLNTAGIPYIAMELLHGDDLAAILRRDHRLDTEATLAMVRDVATGLDAAHAAGIIHRDLKPQNLFQHRGVDDAPLWKILDFGISKLAGSQGTLTQRAVIGTPGYMSPEQARGVGVDRRCDVFSFGAVAYRAITGRPPFGGADLPQKLFAIVYNQPPRPGLVVDGLSRDVDRALAIALAKDPKARYESARAFADAMTRAFAGRLDSKTRARADALLAQQPWGHQGNA